MKRFMAAFLCVLALVSAVVPATGLAASSKGKNRIVYILNVDNEDARVRKEPNSDSDNVEVKLKKGTKVFYLGNEGSWYKIRSEYGVIGYTYKGFLSYYGASKLKDIYSADGSVTVYKRPRTTSGRAFTLSDNQHVIVYATSGKWAYIHTLSGEKGYVLKSKLNTPS